MQRKLTGMERLMWMGGQHKPINFVLSCEVENDTVPIGEMALAHRHAATRQPNYHV
jgi:hypothetical protein